MGRKKEYRQRLKYQVSSVRRKSVEQQIAGSLMNELGMSVAESRLLSRRMRVWLQRSEGFRDPNQIVFEASAGRGNFIRNGKGACARIKLTPYEEEDLDVELESGLKTMQAARIARMIEQAYEQDALLSIRNLVWLTNITPTSLRGRLKAFREQGIYVPYLGLSRQERGREAVLRSTWALSRYLAGESVVEIRRKAAMSKGAFTDILSAFTAMACGSADERTATEREAGEWRNLLRSSSPARLKKMLSWGQRAPRAEKEDEIAYELRAEYGMAPVKVRAVMELFHELEDTLSESRSEHTVIYWAVASDEPAGKPLEACKLVPVRLSLIHEEDLPGADRDADFNCVREMKYRKALRYATEARYNGGYLTYADLGYVLGIHPAAISKIVQQNPKIILPLRGFSCDIGRGLTHRRHIVSLFLQMYTETQIADRTGHSYEAIENYLKEFATVMLLHEQGLTVALIRKVTGRSTRLIETYLELLREYSNPEYAFRLNYLRRVAQTSEGWAKKGGLGW